MADTARSIADLLTLFADNTSGAISEQDLRDFVETMRPRHGSYYFTTPAETTISASSTPTKAAGTTTVVNVNDGFSMPANNRLLYTGSVDVHAHIACSVSFTSASNNQKIGIMIAKNGTKLDHTEVFRTVGTGSEEGSTAVHGDVMLTSGDHLELFFENETSSGNVTMEHGYLFALGMVM